MFLLWMNILFSLLILQSSAGSKHSDSNPIRKLIPCDDEKVEPFIRSLVANATAQLPNPYPLPRQEKFVILADGSVTGLSTLSPNHSTTIVCKDDVVEIRAHLKVQAMNGKYKWLRQLLTRTIDGDVYMTAEKFQAYIKISQNMDKTGNQTQPIVTSCTVTIMEDFDIQVTGQEAITWPINKITGPAKTAFEDTVHSAVQDVFKNALATLLEGVTLAVKT